MKHQWMLMLLCVCAAVYAGAASAENIYLERGILDTGSSSASAVLDQNAASSSVCFDKNANPLTFTAEPSYNLVRRLVILNNGDSARSVKVSFAAPDDIYIGVNVAGGESPVTIPPKMSLSLPFKIFTHDTAPGTYPVSVRMIDERGFTADTISGAVTVKEQKPDIVIRKIRQDGCFAVYEAENRGKAAANVSIGVTPAGAVMNPAVEHYFFQEKEKIIFTLSAVDPSALAQKREFEISSNGRLHGKQNADFTIPDGGRIEMISLDPIVRLRQKDWYCTNRPVIHFNYDLPYVKRDKADDAGFTAKFSWLKEKGKPYDFSGDGKADSWTLVENGRTLMAGDDYDGDGSLDYFRECDSIERQLNRAWVKISGTWNETNIVDAYIISSFLPFHDGDSVRPHTMKIFVNDAMIAEERNTVPAGTRLYRLRVDYLAANSAYGVSRNKITIKTEHLPKTEYLVNAENTMLIYYSSIQIPVKAEKALNLSTEESDAKIREQEKQTAAETNAVKKEAMENALKEYRAFRDKKLKDASEYIARNGDIPIELSGVQYRGLDFGVYASELAVKGKTVSGTVRNMGYLAGAYSLSLYRLEKGSFRLLSSQKGSGLPPFCWRQFSFDVKDHAVSARSVYKIILEPADKNAQELVQSNNTAHVTVGPERGPAEMKAEMKILAGEMGLTNDRVTLSRAAELPDFNNLGLDRINGRDIDFPGDEPAVKKKIREFILEQ